MRPGNIPRFGPSLHTPHRALNDLSRQVGELQIQVAPPLFLEPTPCGLLIGLHEEEGSSAASPSEVYSGVGLEVLTVPSGTTVTGESFTLTEAGVYLVTGVVATLAQVTGVTRANLARISLFPNVTGGVGTIYSQAAYEHHVHPQQPAAVYWHSSSVSFFVGVTSPSVVVALDFFTQGDADFTYAEWTRAYTRLSAMKLT